MNASWTIFRAFGIPVRLHWTFALLAGFVGVTTYSQGGAAAAFAMVSLLLAVFACVVLHEFGHALTARRFGIRTRDITLLPIGGIAAIERMPSKPMQEFWIAVAGPAVNVIIAAVIGLIGLAIHGPAGIVGFLSSGSFLSTLLWINLALIVFNMIPAFPLDGGRVLRALLWQWLGRGRGTDIAARIGQVAAVGLGIAGIATGNFILALIAVFIFLSAGGEASAIRTSELLRGVPASAVMNQSFHVLDPGEPLVWAMTHLRTGFQSHFPVVSGGYGQGGLGPGGMGQATYRGMVFGEDLARSAAMADRGATVAAITRPLPAVSPDDELETVFAFMQQHRAPAVAVMEAGRLVGMITLEGIAYAQSRQSQEARSTQQPGQDAQRKNVAVRPLSPDG